MIGIPLDLESREVDVGRFAADLLAGNPQDGSLVLIENQLERSDHSHLGQILTYLAGLEAKTIIWIAREFDEAHRSAVNWLNEHTTDPFAFFAVRLKVVQIGDSQLAPVFEIVEQPNEWDRRIHAVARESSELSELGLFRREFWEYFFRNYPGEIELRKNHAASWVAHEVPGAVPGTERCGSVRARPAGRVERGRFLTPETTRGCDSGGAGCRNSRGTEG